MPKQTTATIIQKFYKHKMSFSRNIPEKQSKWGRSCRDQSLTHNERTKVDFCQSNQSNEHYHSKKDIEISHKPACIIASTATHTISELELIFQSLLSQDEGRQDSVHAKHRDDGTIEEPVPYELEGNVKFPPDQHQYYFLGLDVIELHHMDVKQDGSSFQSLSEDSIEVTKRRRNRASLPSKLKECRRRSRAALGIPTTTRSPKHVNRSVRSCAAA